MSGLEIIGPILAGIGSIGSGVAGMAAANQEAKQMKAQAKEEVAASQREATEKRREGALVMSAQQARAAASGAGAGTDAPSIVRLMTDTAGQAEYNAGTVRYGGEQRAQGLLQAARNRKATGAANLFGSVLGGFGEMASGFSKYKRRSAY